MLGQIKWTHGTTLVSAVLCSWSHLVEVADDLVEQTNALNAVSTDRILSTELPELGNRRKHHHDRVIRLVVQILAKPNTFQHKLYS